MMLFKEGGICDWLFCYNGACDWLRWQMKTSLSKFLLLLRASCYQFGKVLANDYFMWQHSESHINPCTMRVKSNFTGIFEVSMVWKQISSQLFPHFSTPRNRTWSFLSSHIGVRCLFVHLKDALRSSKWTLNSSHYETAPITFVVCNRIAHAFICCRPCYACLRNALCRTAAVVAWTKKYLLNHIGSDETSLYVVKPQCIYR